MTGKFELAYEVFLKSHMDSKSKDREELLSVNHGYEEMQFLKNVWWPLFGNLDHLYPEYEVRDWCGKGHFADFAYLPGHLKFLIEIKDNAYERVANREDYADGLNRELFLQASGYRVISLAYDDVEQRPELCKYLLQMLLIRYQPGLHSTDRPLLAEMEMIRLALNSPLPICSQNVAEHFNTDHQAAVRMLQSLCQAGWLRPLCTKASEGIHYYELIRGEDELMDEAVLNKRVEALYTKTNLPVTQRAPEGICN
ncbi:hypothetical protein KB559_14465 [Paenibacillus sp. Marseille-P2973]|uniref:hypothetical protein n=1 Tax=Paenibacillus sp. Marseille-P2973 TaxID=1871032 RepID=UPI001B393552|nr:hypothetical protein [Paenibacillus sp. Marseille-P2973]MBQ4900033.1 hypothetical protein [Paenibacillus sp. Marseille-P2973]